MWDIVRVSDLGSDLWLDIGSDLFLPFWAFLAILANFSRSGLLWPFWATFAVLGCFGHFRFFSVLGDFLSF